MFGCFSLFVCLGLFWDYSLFTYLYLYNFITIPIKETFDLGGFVCKK